MTACNPCATITALAERICDKLAKAKGWSIDFTPNENLDLDREPTRRLRPGLAININSTLKNAPDNTNAVKFDEVLEGYIAFGDELASAITVPENMTRRVGSFARLRVSVTVLSTRGIAEESYESSIVTGSFFCGALSRDPLLVTGGNVRFFTADEDVFDGANLIYDLELLDSQAKPFTLKGRKYINSSMAFSPRTAWRKTSTLHTHLTNGAGSTVGKGILRLSKINFLKELLSLRGIHGTSNLTRQFAVARFLHFFARKTFPYFLGPFRPLQYPTSTPTFISKKRDSALTPITASDGIKFSLRTWEPAPNVAKHSTPIVLIPGASVDDTIFSCPTIETNTVDYFTSLGYRCYVPVLRFGIGPAADEGHTAYDARLDVKATLQYVRKRENNEKIYVIAHCLGSIAAAMALLNGDVPADWLQGMTCSQVFMNLRFSKDNALKAATQLPVNLYRVRSNPIPSYYSWTNLIFSTHEL
jgi:hypothetical protein